MYLPTKIGFEVAYTWTTSRAPIWEIIKERKLSYVCVWIRMQELLTLKRHTFSSLLLLLLLLLLFLFLFHLSSFLTWDQDTPICSGLDRSKLKENQPIKTSYLTILHHTHLPLLSVTATST